MRETFDAFISYRRNTGSTLANRIYDFFVSRRLNVFLDTSEMKAGKFSEQIVNNIIGAGNFILVLSKGALDNCFDEDDWVRKEIKTALGYNVNIVLAIDDDFSFPQDLPDDIKEIRNFEAVFFNNNNFKERILHLEKLLILSPVLNEYLSENDYGKKSTSLTGEYMTYYEDYENGKLVIRRAPAKLKQFFSRVTGDTVFDGTRKWKLSGRVYNGSRIVGIYSADDKFDEGIGTFFLEIKNFNHLEGYWSGYDSANRRLTTGSYVFNRLFTSYSIYDVSKKDIPSICALADAALGKDYVTPQTVADLIDDGVKSFCIVMKNSYTDELLGFCIYKIISKEEAVDICKGKVLPSLYAEDQLGYLATIVVSEKYRGNGLATVLIDKVTDIFAQMNITHIISTAWKHIGKINLQGVLTRCGYKKVMEIPDYWYEDSIKKGYSCPQCGNPCHCSCVIFEKF